MITDVHRSWLATEVASVLRGQRQRAPEVLVEGLDAVDVDTEDLTLPEIRRALGDCQRCGLCKTRTKIVFGKGDPEARLLVIGEAPGETEDRTGEPFVGSAGRMLDKMLRGVLGLRREQVYIANILKCQPPNNRNPSREEMEACRPFLEAQIRSLHPDAILLLGSVALKGLLGTPEGITRHRGVWKQLVLGGGPGQPLYEIDVMPTFHPAFLARKPEHKPEVHGHLLELRARLKAMEDTDA